VAKLGREVLVPVLAEAAPRLPMMNAAQKLAHGGVVALDKLIELALRPHQDDPRWAQISMESADKLLKANLRLCEHEFRTKRTDALAILLEELRQAKAAEKVDSERVEK